jgi:hypothetical protein
MTLYLYTFYEHSPIDPNANNIYLWAPDSNSLLESLVFLQINSQNWMGEVYPVKNSRSIHPRWVGRVWTSEQLAAMKNKVKQVAQAAAKV